MIDFWYGLRHCTKHSTRSTSSEYYVITAEFVLYCNNNCVMRICCMVMGRTRHINYHCNNSYRRIGNNPQENLSLAAILGDILSKFSVSISIIIMDFADVIFLTSIVSADRPLAPAPLRAVAILAQ